MEHDDDIHGDTDVARSRSRERGTGSPVPRRHWSGSELAAFCRVRMAEPVFVELSGLPAGAGERMRTLTQAQGLLLTSLRDLFHHPAPPLELLQIVKDFAKANAYDPQSPYPQEISLILYYESLAAALVKLGRRITRLTDAELRQGLEWAAASSWMDPADRALLERAVQVIT